MRATHALLALPLLVLAVSTTACSTTKFTGKIVSCADQKPIKDAGLKYKSVNSMNNNMAGSMAPETKDDGTYEADVALASGAGIMMTVDKDGYEEKQVPLTSGSEQVTCLDPKKH